MSLVEFELQKFRKKCNLAKPHFLPNLKATNSGIAPYEIFVYKNLSWAKMVQKWPFLTFWILTP